METSTAKTWIAPFCSRQSVKPPVELPTSRQIFPEGERAKSVRAPSSFRPPRLTYFCGSPMSSMRASVGTWVPGLESFWPLTRTLPARRRAWARSREGARPRSKMRTSRRVLLGCFTLIGVRRISCGGAVAIEERSFVAALLWMTAKGGWVKWVGTRRRFARIVLVMRWWCQKRWQSHRTPKVLGRLVLPAWARLAVWWNLNPHPLLEGKAQRVRHPEILILRQHGRARP